MTPRTLSLITALLALACALPSTARAVSPQAGRQLFVDCEASHENGAKSSNPWYWERYWQRHGSPAKAALVAKIATVPTAKWFAGNSIRTKHSRRKMFERYFARVDDPKWGGPSCATHLRRGARGAYVGTYPVLVVRALKYDRCRGFDGGGAWGRYHGPYRGWIDDFAAALRRRWAGPFRYKFWAHTVWPRRYFRATVRPATVVLEPDALALMSRRSGCLTHRARVSRYALLRYAARKLGALRRYGITTYIDAGSSSWARPGEAVSMLRRAGVRFVRGFATNSTHYNATPKERAYGNRIARVLRKHYVINTAENGRGALPKRYWTHGTKSMWCNPKNAGLGTRPTTRTGSGYADALLWISRPGISSNGKVKGEACGRGPLGNVWWNARAFQLARKAVFSRLAWPPAPM
jgi:hypothetical protein